MSFSVVVIGRPEKLIEALDAERSSMSGQSLKEYEEALPHLKGIIGQNVGGSTILSVSASGHATFNEAGEKTFGSCNVSVNAQYGKIAM